MNLSKHILDNRVSVNNSMFKPIPPIICKDGFTVSIQAGSFIYCTPQNKDGPWTHFEMGYPTVPMGEEFIEYAEDKDSLTETVYNRVPEELIVKLLESHGGVCINTFFQNISS